MQSMLRILVVLVPFVFQTQEGPLQGITLADGTVLADAVLQVTELRIQQPYGVLTVPVGDIKMVQTRVRLTAGEDKKAGEAIAALASDNDDERLKANNTLMGMKRKAMPQLCAFMNDAKRQTNKRQMLMAQGVYIAISAMPAQQMVIKDAIYSVKQERVEGDLVETTIQVYSQTLGQLSLPVDNIISIFPKK